MKLLNTIITFFLLFLLFPFATSANTWTISYDGVGIDSPKYVQETSDGGFIVAGSSRSAYANGNNYPYWLQKLDAKGNIAWQKAYGVGTDWGGSLYAITETADNGFIIAGRIEPGAGPQNSLDLLKLDHSGNIIWQKSFGIGHEYPRSIIETSDGDIVVAGTSTYGQAIDHWPWILKLKGNGDVISQKGYPVGGGGAFHSIKETSDGGLVAAGYALNPDPVNWTDLCVVKLDANGNVTWKNVYDTNPANEEANAIMETSDGGFIVTGSVYHDDQEETSMALILKLDSSGNTLWLKQNNEGTGLASDVIEASNGGFIITGGIFEPGQSRHNTWLVKMDNNGDPLWQKKYGKDFFSNGKSIGKTSDGGLIVASEIITPPDSHIDFWILKLDGEGNHPGCDLVGEATNVIFESRTVHQLSPDSGSIDMEMWEGQEFLFSSADTDAQITQTCNASNEAYPIRSSFDDGPEGFIYYDDEMKNTDQPRYASGDWTTDASISIGGALRVSVGGIDGVDITDGMSGGWRKSFSIEKASEAEIVVDFRLITSRYDADECAQALVAIDGEVVKVLDELCGRDQDTAWVEDYFHHFLTEGEHTLTVGAYNNKKTGPKEKAEAYFDNISIKTNVSTTSEAECVDGLDNDEDGFTDCDDSDCSDSDACQTEAVFSDDLNADDDHFQYHDDIFNDTHRAPYAVGNWAASIGNGSSGGLHLTLGNVDGAHITDGISGGWTTSTFDLNQSADLTISLDYRLVMTQFDADECAQVLVSIDNGPFDMVEELCGRGKDSGWKSHEISKSLSAGEHTLTIGGFNNKKTGAREKADIYFDNIVVK